MKHALILISLLMPLFLSAQTNIQWRGTDRSGIYHEQGLLTQWPESGPALKWHFDELGEGHSSVAIDADKLYLTGLKGDKGYLYVFDLNGKLLSTKEYGPEWTESYNGPRGTVTINDSKIYLTSGYGVLYCLDQNTLNLVWKKDFLSEFNASNISWGINEAPLIVDDKVIATPGGSKGNIVAFNKNTGELIWTCAGEGDLSAYCSPQYISDQEVPQIVTITANHVIGVDVKTGQKLWSIEKTNRWSVHANTPVYSKGMLLCTSGYGGGSVMLRLTDGGRHVEKVWESTELDNRLGSMVKVGNYVYGSGDKNRYWFCADWNTGEIKYKQNGYAMGNIIADEGMLYCYTDRGNMLLAKATPEKFDVVSKFPITMGTAQHWAHPVLYKGLLLVRHGNSLMAYQVK
ncbi:PQQ-binding-like beta-propeller repeat protein [Mangrovibacterium marinum]|uniref:Outer membrane protein assembly factor BamB n=1 Tax=Mangrovibacterium marinum TaxID=1639118 RepID=A0A2T5C0W3_9BACT|nr:PQQ-binding-like beta-propeller repeat protein [Mangrovibacterium marinum]PTN08230.1 outer membrane protein assembly factor BamB [Mangrovibacterium marinum]